MPLVLGDFRVIVEVRLFLSLRAADDVWDRE
jgi:hypothetical protein